MALERAATSSSLIDVLDRVLDKGIIIDAWVRVSLVWIELVTVEARVVVASISTYLCYADVLAELKPSGAAPREPVAARALRRPGLIVQRERDIRFGRGYRQQVGKESD
jgi:gas vesicle structural protein